MKKLAFLMLSITALLTSNSALGQHYHEDDKEGLRQFLRQQSSAPTKLNIEVLNTMSLADTLDWYTSETWVDKLTRANYLLWENMPKRLTTIKIESKSISGILDCELFPMIRYIYCKQNGLRGVNLPNNPNLLKLDCSNNKLVTIDLSNCPQLNYLSLHYNQLTDINTTNCLELTDILCRSNYLVSLDVTTNANLKNLVCNLNKITSLDVSNNLLLNRLDCYSNLLSSLDVSNNTELANLVSHTNNLTSLDVSNNPELKLLACNGNRISSLDVTNNPKLQTLNCDNNQLSSLNVTNNPILESFTFANNQITQIDLSNNILLSTLKCVQNQLTTLDLTTFLQLEFLDCSYNQLTTLDLSNKTDLNKLLCGYNQLTSLDVSDCSFLSVFQCHSNRLRFSTLNIDTEFNMTYFKISPQAIIYMDDVPANDIIDLASEYSFDNHITDYKWYKQETSGAIRDEITLSQAGNGQFIAPEEYIGDTLVCRMTNAKYTGLTLTYKVKITKPRPTAPQLTSSLLFLNPSSERNYLVSTSQTFWVRMETSDVNKNMVSLGLFDRITGEFVSDIVVSRTELPDGMINDGSDNHPYFKCQPNVSESVDYIIQPYFLRDNTIISRPEGSHFIDRLPLTVKGRIIFGSLSTPAPLETGGRTINQNMSLTTTSSSLMYVSTGQMFSVSIPFAGGNPAVKIGLFDWSDGSFVESVGTYTSGNNYECRASTNVLSGNYIVMPYKEIRGEIVVVERPAGKPYLIDRLPLYVHNTIWGVAPLSIDKDTMEAASISVSPNPTQGQINLGAVCEQVEIYNISGVLIKKDSNTNTMDISNYPNGIYILKIETGNSFQEHRILKHY